jgi:hypothetical protein
VASDIAFLPLANLCCSLERPRTRSLRSPLLEVNSIPSPTSPQDCRPVFPKRADLPAATAASAEVPESRQERPQPASTGGHYTDLTQQWYLVVVGLVVDQEPVPESVLIETWNLDALSGRREPGRIDRADLVGVVAGIRAESTKIPTHASRSRPAGTRTSNLLIDGSTTTHLRRTHGYVDHTMVEPNQLRELLDEFRFEDAQRLLDEAEDTGTDLGNEIATRRTAAEKQAEVVAQRLVDLGEEGQLDEFLLMVDDPITRRLVALASPSARDRVDLYLQEAERWRKHQMEINGRRLGEARRALEGLDLGLAQGVMSKVDERYLSDEGREERDQLLLDMSARTMDIESLAQLGGKVKRPHRAGRRKPGRRRRK